MENLAVEVVKEQATGDLVEWKQIRFNEEGANLKADVEILLSLPGERILNGLDAAIRKIELLTILPQFYKFIMNLNNFMRGSDEDFDAVNEGDMNSLNLWNEKLNTCNTHLIQEMAFNLQDEFVQNLMELEICQWGWRLSKNGNVKRSVCCYSTLKKEDKDGPVVDERGHETHLVNLSGMSPTTTKRQEGADLDKKRQLVSVLKADKSRCNFFQDLLNSQILTTTTEAKKGDVSDDISNKSIVKLLKTALQGRYSSHVRKSMKNHDLQSLICILSIVAQNSIQQPQKVTNFIEHEYIEAGEELPTLDFSSVAEDAIETVMGDEDPETLLKCSTEIVKSEKSVENDDNSMRIFNEINEDQFDVDKSNSSVTLPLTQLSSKDFSEEDESLSRYLVYSQQMNLDEDKSSSSVQDIVRAEITPAGYHRRMDSDENICETCLKPIRPDNVNYALEINKRTRLNSTDRSRLVKSSISKSKRIADIAQVKKTSVYESLLTLTLKENEQLGTECDFFKFSHTTLLELRLKYLYRQVLDHLAQNPKLITSLKNIYTPSSADKFIPCGDAEKPKLQSTLLSESGFECFMINIKKLRSLMKSRLTLNADQNSRQVVRTNVLLLKEQMMIEKIDQLKRMLVEKHSTWESKLLKSETEIEELGESLRTILFANHHRVFETVKALETAKIVQEKYHQKKIINVNSDAEVSEERLEDSLKTLAGGYKGLQKYRRSLENELQRVKTDYNMTMHNQQQVLIDLLLKEKNNEKEIKRLQEIHKVVEENYEDMKTTKRLRELLQNLRMAESVKQNWAARRIQEAWRKYKVLKWRKRRFKKGGGKKKKKKDDDSNPQITKGPKKSINCKKNAAEVSTIKTQPFKKSIHPNVKKDNGKRN